MCGNGQLTVVVAEGEVDIFIRYAHENDFIGISQVTIMCGSSHIMHSVNLCYQPAQNSLENFVRHSYDHFKHIRANIL
ncbi:uncharacterized protein PHALS_14848 [Plasmopara halstedii]|uniref:Uncharacterized protein n=1 Tax=Plasmopara halstedii TaxID=4781 RepID=A0A0P1A7N9_PLAHL|nr:uncharacterized protein PHALS_14848 [Plasmopara halstedii]CEG36295.1 hypothetical protein PHALS_14848 [Plasmopara halstedii]|eukprot:XP_024572664.1 hypothetical protein PHALS_14848 [Plasmopara halstedii]